jgi:hypothetical protein
MYQYGAARLTTGSTISLGLTTALEVDGSNSFSIAIWIRLESGNEAEQIILQRPGIFTIIVRGRSVGAVFGGLDLQGVEAATPLLPLQLGKWQYVVVTYQLGTGTTGGTLTSYIDGFQASDPTAVTPSVTDTYAAFIVGDAASGAQFEVASVVFWSSCLTVTETTNECRPEWGPPAAGTPSVAAAFDFASGPAADVSGNNYPVTLVGAKQHWLSPGVKLDGTAYVDVGTTDGINPGNGNSPFTVYAWICMLSPHEQGAFFRFPKEEYRNVFTNTQNLVLAVGFSGPNSQAYSLSIGNNSCSEAIYPAVIRYGSWHHVALTFDGSMASVYTDGALVFTLSCTNSIPPIDAAQFTVGNSGWLIPNSASFGGYIQALGVWSTCLTASEVATYMTADPTGQEGCIGFFSFMETSGANAVTGTPYGLYMGAKLSEDSRPMTSNTLDRVDLNQNAVGAHPASILDLPIPPDFNPTIRPSNGLLDDAEMDEIISGFDYYSITSRPSIAARCMTASSPISIRDYICRMQLLGRLPE